MRPVNAVLVVLITSLVFAQGKPAAAPNELPKLEHFSAEQLDKSVDPCTDFFKYACSKWIKANPIPADQAGWGTFNSLAIWNVAALHSTLEAVATPAANRGPVEKQAGDYYASCMDEATIDRLGITPLQPVLEKIAKLNSKAQLPELIATLHKTIRPANLNFIDPQYQGILFGLYSQPDFDDASQVVAVLDQSGFGMPGREFYTKDDEKSKQIRELYLKHIAKMLELSGESPAQAATDAKSVMEIENSLAVAAMDIVARRDPKNLNNKRNLKQLQAMTPDFNWSKYLTAMKVPASQTYLVTAPDFFTGMQKLIATEPLDRWRAYLKYSTISFMAPFLSKPMVDENFDFFGKTLSGTQVLQPRWRRCSRSADADLGEAVGQAYVAKYFPPENKARMLQMVKAIEKALDEDIDSATWMSPQTKKLAHAKLTAQIDKIAYPDRWTDYSSVTVKRDDYLGNVARASEFEINRRIALIGKPTNRYLWGMTPPTVNAYEDSQSNTINFPAGILQPPFFDASQPDAVNYGAIGGVIGHEITHGYDDQGRKFDSAGNLKDWWTPEDAKNYDERDACITDEYTQDVPEAGPGVRQNGKLSAGEDTADNGGVHIALAGLQDTLQSQGKGLDDEARDGLTNAQAFFLGWATVWCGDNRQEAARTAVMTQGHSLNPYRVNNVVANMPEFARAFNCKAGQQMVHARACRVW